jgi:hypothetical protein
MRSARIGVCIFFLCTLAMGQAVPSLEQPLVPSAAQPGGPSFTLTLKGANFVPTPKVFFGGTQLTILTHTATQLTATVPANILTAGTAPVSVQNDDGMTADLGFFQIATPSSPLFLAPVTYNPLTTGTGTIQSILVADLNGDGILDLAVGVVVPETNIVDVAILLGKSDGTFQAPTVYGVSDVTSMVAGIFDNDGGSVDIVAGDNLLVGNGDGTFNVTGLGTEGFIPYAVGDFSQDSDLWIAGTEDGGVQILQNNGAGTFSFGQSFSTGAATFGGMLTADFNNDGVLDLAVLDTNPSVPAVRVFLGNTETGFSGGNGIPTDTPQNVVAFTAADVNNDGNQDLVLVDNPPAGGGAIAVLTGNGDGTFGSGASVTLAAPVTGTIVTGDFNEDGKIDLATGTFIIPGNGDGTFQTPISFGGTSQVIGTGDFNNDGRPDIVTQANPDLAILLQQAPGGAPVVSLSPPTLTFSSQTVGTTSASQTITLSNTGNAVLAIDSLTITGANAGEFNQTNSCSASLAANLSCTINVTFTPTAAGPAAAAVTFTDNAAGSPQAVSLNGTGAGQTGAPIVSLSPATLTFNGQAVGTTTSLPVTLTNTGTANLGIDNIGVTGPDAEEFSQTNNCGKLLAPNASCTITVTFAPTNVGTATASISITDNAAGSPQMVPLPAEGAPFQLTTTCTSLNVVPGQTAVFTVDLAPAEEFSPTVSLSCSGAPALTTCSPIPNTVTLNGEGPVEVIVRVTTTQATGYLQPPFGRSNENRVAGLVGLTGIAGLAALVVLPGKRRVKRARRLWGLIVFLCLLAAIAALPSCGGGGDPPGTTAGTYPLTVTGTFQQEEGGPITETVGFNLVVQ